jgi:hypothetical protein
MEQTQVRLPASFPSMVISKKTLVVTFGPFLASAEKARAVKRSPKNKTRWIIATSLAGLGPRSKTETMSVSTISAVAVSAPAAKPLMPSFIPAWLSDNPMFTAGFGLFGVGAAMAILRTGAGISAQMAKRRFLATLEIPSRDYSYQWVMQWLISKNGINARHLGVETCYTKDSAGNARTSFDYIPSPGRHWMNHKGAIIMVDRDRQQTAMDSTVGTPFETLTLTTAAWHRGIFDEILREARDRALAKEEGRTVIYHASGHDWRPFGPPKRIRPIESVILADGVAESLIADVDDFRRRGDWYAERGIPYRRGYLLHGPPGSGKSSFTLALAGRLRVGVAALNVGDPTLTDERRAPTSSLAPIYCLLYARRSVALYTLGYVRECREYNSGNSAPRAVAGKRRAQKHTAGHTLNVQCSHTTHRILFFDNTASRPVSRQWQQPHSYDPAASCRAALTLRRRAVPRPCPPPTTPPSARDCRLHALLASAPPHAILLLEDIDGAVSPDEAPPMPIDPLAPPALPVAAAAAGGWDRRVSFSGLLNALDGVTAGEERLVVMTTNKCVPNCMRMYTYIYFYVYACIYICMYVGVVVMTTDYCVLSLIPI